MSNLPFGVQPDPRAPETKSQSPIVSVKTYRKSGDAADYFVSIAVGDREVTPHVFSERFKAEYHVALYDWLLNGAPKPDLMAFNPGDWPARVQPSAITLDTEEMLLLMRLRDNQQNNVHDVVENDQELWRRGHNMSDRGLLAMASHPLGGIFHITKLGMLALNAALPKAGA